MRRKTASTLLVRIIELGHGAAQRFAGHGWSRESQLVAMLGQVQCPPPLRDLEKKKSGKSKYRQGRGEKKGEMAELSELFVANKRLIADSWQRCLCMTAETSWSIISSHSDSLA